jgi:DNA (cytosine-5)-methyltransferase 1
MIASRPAIESYQFTSDQTVTRQVTLRSGHRVHSEIEVASGVLPMSPDAAFDLSWLRSKTAPVIRTTEREVRVVDLFAGCGGLSVGVAEACRALNLRMFPVYANDVDPAILDIYCLNFPSASVHCAPIESILDGACGEVATTAERRLASDLNYVDLVIGGPPCQGHSDFNNHTRNDDPKNELYLRMARFCEIIRPQHVIIENVPGVERDKRGVATRTWNRLRELGYFVDSGILDSSRLGVAQKRKRSITIASLARVPSVKDALTAVEVRPRDLRWAIDDLRFPNPVIGDSAVFDRPPQPNPTNRARIDYLFDNGLWELPDEQRPDCHRLKDHSYGSVYGRLHWDRPTPTITTGFGTMGRGRFVHPAERRTITPHEAARIQFFPDFFNFGDSSRSLVQKVIGNAVPPKLGYALGLHLLR